MPWGECSCRVEVRCEQQSTGHYRQGIQETSSYSSTCWEFCFWFSLDYYSGNAYYTTNEEDLIDCIKTWQKEHNWQSFVTFLSCKYIFILWVTSPKNNISKPCSMRGTDRTPSKKLYELKWKCFVPLLTIILHFLLSLT